MAGHLPQSPTRKPRLRVVSAPGAVFLLRDGEWSIELTPAIAQRSVPKGETAKAVSRGDRLATAVREQTKQARLLMSARGSRTLEPVT